MLRRPADDETPRTAGARGINEPRDRHVESIGIGEQDAACDVWRAHALKLTRNATCAPLPCTPGVGMFEGQGATHGDDVHSAHRTTGSRQRPPAYGDLGGGAGPG